MVANLAGVDAGDVSDLARRSMKQRAGFLACMCRDVLPERYLLKLFCLVIVVIFFLKGFISILSVLSTYNLTQETRDDCEFVFQ